MKSIYLPRYRYCSQTCYVTLINLHELLHGGIILFSVLLCPSRNNDGWAGVSFHLPFFVFLSQSCRLSLDTFHNKEKRREEKDVSFPLLQIACGLLIPTPPHPIQLIRMSHFNFLSLFVISSNPIQQGRRGRRSFWFRMVPF